MAQYSKEIKNAVYIRIIEGQSVKKISGEMKISPNTICRWKKDLIKQYIKKDSGNDFKPLPLMSELTILIIKLYS